VACGRAIFSSNVPASTIPSAAPGANNPDAGGQQNEAKNQTFGRINETKDAATFLPFGDLMRALKTTKKLVWFLDDLGQASPAVQAACMQLLLARQIDGHKIPDKVTFVAATNRRTDRAGVSGILEPVKSRFGIIGNLEPDLNDFKQWWYKTDYPVEPLGYLNFQEGDLHNWEPTADIVNQPCPRTWENVGKILKMKQVVSVLGLTQR